MSLIIGLDPHKASNTIAVLEPDETIRVTQRFENSDAGFAAMLKYVEGFRDRKWAVEGASGMGRSVAQLLVRAGETVVDMPAKLAAQIRVYATGHGRKTDTTAAISIAKAAIRSKRPRPVAVDDDLVALKLLVDRRKELVSMRVQSMCRPHRLLRKLISGGARQRLSTDEAEKILETVEFIGPAGLMRREIAVDHLNDVLAIDARIDQINLRIQEAAKTIGTTLVDITGIALISAATIMATMDTSRNQRLHHPNVMHGCHQHPPEHAPSHRVSSPRWNAKLISLVSASPVTSPSQLWRLSAGISNRNLYRQAGSFTTLTITTSV